MRGRVAVLLVLAAAGALWLFGRPAELQFPHAQIGPATLRVLAAKRPLPAGTRLVLSDLAWIDWPAATLPEGALTDAGRLFGAGPAPVLRRSLRAGAPLLSGALLEPVPGAPAADLAAAGVVSPRP
jgi:Flp pilus assembly protein CpaB